MRAWLPPTTRVIGPLSVLSPMTLRMPSDPPGSLRWAKVIGWLMVISRPLISSRAVEPTAAPVLEMWIEPLPEMLPVRRSTPWAISSTPLFVRFQGPNVI